MCAHAAGAIARDHERAPSKTPCTRRPTGHARWCLPAHCAQLCPTCSARASSRAPPRHTGGAHAATRRHRRQRLNTALISSSLHCLLRVRLCSAQVCRHSRCVHALPHLVRTVAVNPQHARAQLVRALEARISTSSPLWLVYGGARGPAGDAGAVCRSSECCKRSAELALSA